eukprot:12892981-Prorocentrum_lima.AAC.1
MALKTILNDENKQRAIFILAIPNNNKNSPTKLLVPGKAILARVKKKKKITKRGIKKLIPL